MTAKFNGDVEFSKRDSSTFELSMEGKGAYIDGKGGATMSMELSLNAYETSTEVSCIMTVSITGRIAQFGSRMIEANSLNNSYRIFPICLHKKMKDAMWMRLLQKQNRSKQHHF